MRIILTLNLLLNYLIIKINDFHPVNNASRPTVVCAAILVVLMSDEAKEYLRLH